MKKHLCLGLWLVSLVVSCLIGIAPAYAVADPTPTPTPYPLTTVLEDMQGAPWDAVQLMATDQASNDGPRFGSAPTQVPDYENFEGEFSPVASNTKLAIFSDDGADVYIDGIKVHSGKNQPQALPALDESLHKIDYQFEADHTYLIRIEYSNTIYQGATDIDGCTLFAYTDSGVTPTPTPPGNNDAQITITFPQDTYYTSTGTQAEVTLTGTSIGNSADVSITGPGFINPENLTMLVGTSRLVNITTPGRAGTANYRASIDGTDTYNDATLTIMEKGFTGTNGTPPATPTLYNVVPGDGQVTVSWYPVSGATGYRIYWSGSNNTSGVLTVPGIGYSPLAGLLTYTQTNLTNGLTYNYTITAFNDAGESGHSNPGSAVPHANPPDPPSYLSAVPGDQQVSLSWRASATPGVVAYWVFRATGANGENRYIGSATGTTYWDSNLNNGTTYYYVVQAVKRTTDGQWLGSSNSNIAAATPTAPSPPGQPGSLTATPGDKQATLSWGSSTGATDYTIKRLDPGGNGYYDIVTRRASQGTTYTDSGLTNGATYSYEVVGVNSGGASSPAGPASVTPQGAAPPGTPGTLTATAGDKSVQLRWTAISGATNYTIKRRAANQAEYGDIETVQSPQLTYLDNNHGVGLANGTTYYYEVVGVNGGGASAPAGPAAATPQGTAPPSPPTQAPVPLNATPGDGRVTLSWGTTPGATNYTLKRRDPYQSAYHDIRTVAASTHSYTDTGLTNGGVYYYEVVGVNGGGGSPPAGPIQAMPRAPITVDALIRNQGEATYDGDDRYNMVGTFQYKQQAVPANTAAVYNLKVQNDGTVATAIKITGPAGGSGWSVHYYDALTGGNDITAQVTGTGWTTPSKLTAGAMRELRFSVTPSGSVAYGAIKDLLVRATAVADATKADVVKASTSVGQGIAKLQYSLDEGTTWKDVPQMGAAGYPITLNEPTEVTFKAVKANSTAAWPSGKPVWAIVGDTVGDTGETTTVYFDDAGQNINNLQTITAECHNTVAADIKMALPPLDVHSDKASICAGGIASPVHQSTVTAIVRSGGIVVPGAAVAFSLGNSDPQYPASISAANGTWNNGILTVPTDTTGKAQITLTSSPAAGETATVYAAYGGLANEVTVNMAYTEGVVSIDPSDLPTDGTSTAQITMPLSFNGQPVDGHNITWSIVRVWNANGNLVTNPGPAYGSLSPLESTSDADGVAQTTYTVGTLGGTIEFEATDNNLLVDSTDNRATGGPVLAGTTKKQPNKRTGKNTKISYDSVWVVKEKGGVSYGSHAHMFVPDENGGGTWYGFYPDTGFLGHNQGHVWVGNPVPGTVVANDVPPSDWLKENRYVKLSVTPEEAKTIRDAISQSKANPPKYQLSKQNCSTWVGQMLSTIGRFQEELSKIDPVNTPKALLDLLEGVAGVEKHDEGEAVPEWAQGDKAPQ